LKGRELAFQGPFFSSSHSSSERPGAMVSPRWKADGETKARIQVEETRIKMDIEEERKGESKS